MFQDYRKHQYPTKLSHNKSWTGYTKLIDSCPEDYDSSQNGPVLKGSPKSHHQSTFSDKNEDFDIK